MELENQISRQAYIQLLIDVLKKKFDVLKQLMSLTEQQEELIAADRLDEEKFLHLVALKEEHINNLTKLDDGFQKIFDSVKEELIGGRENYTAEIFILKEMIGDITDLNVRLQASEKRNKAKMELYFTMRRKEIKNTRINNKTVTNYYKTMTNQHEVQSFFYDKKK